MQFICRGIPKKSKNNLRLFLKGFHLDQSSPLGKRQLKFMITASWQKQSAEKFSARKRILAKASLVKSVSGAHLVKIIQSEKF